MALGGGTFVVQNKKLPGAYLNFVSAASASATLSDRGIATMPIPMDWGVDGAVFEVTSGDFQKNALKLFGYDYSHEKMKGLRDLFQNIRTLYAYKLTSGGVKASNDFAEARYSGVRGNDLKIVIQKNADNDSKFDVKTVLDTNIVDEQTVEKAEDLVANDFVTFQQNAELAVTAATPLTGGTNGTINGTAYQNYLDKIESYAFHTMGVVVTDETTKALFHSFVKRMRDEMGVKFQLVLYQYNTADYCGTISVKNKVLDDGWSEAALIYWVTGISAGCAVNKSNQNRKYTGEFQFDTDYTQSELQSAMESGEFVFHRVGSDVRVLEDINTLVTISDTQGAVFQDNQTIRVIDQVANDIAVLFNTKYLGVVPNNAAGRNSLWSDIVKHHEQLSDINAIENFTDADLTISAGNTKKSVVVQDAITVVHTMDKLYMTVTVA